MINWHNLSHKFRAIRGLINFLKCEEEFSGEEIKVLKELNKVIIDLFIRFKGDI